MEAVMVSSIVNNDELSDEAESINLDLHVSDTEESTESLKKGDADSDAVESEDAILNKYVESIAVEVKKNKNIKSNGILEIQNEKYKKCNGTISSYDDIEKNDMNDTLTNDKSEEKIDETLLNGNDDAQDNVKLGSANKGGPKDVKCVEKHEDQNSLNSTTQYIETVNTDQSAKCDSTIRTNVARTIEANSPSTELLIKRNINHDKSVPSGEKSSDETTDHQTENEDNDDLLCVMEEKSVEEANENKDESSCSANEGDDETKESEENSDHPNEENIEDIAEETNDEIHEEKNEEPETVGEDREDEETEDNTESQPELDMDASECAMDIEDSDIGGVVYTDTRIISNEQLSNSDKIETDKDANKENEHNGDVTLTDSTIKHAIDADNSLRNGDIETDSEKSITKGLDEEKNEAPKKSIKRQLSDLLPENEGTKKIKLQTEESDKKFMLDKKLKKLTRFELEELCMQKMCECIVNKSEIGELRQKVMIQEQTIDTWRKEAVVVAKQTKDLKIVHERLMAELKVMKEQAGKHLVPVKITRSVGLQAIIEHPSRIRPAPITNGPSQPTRSPIVNSNQQQNKSVLPPQNRSLVKPKAPLPRINSTNNSRPLQPITQKNNNVNSPKPRQTLSSPQQKKTGDPKAVIDLTDEDEKNQNAKQSTAAAPTTVRLLNKQNVGGSPKPTSQLQNPQKIMFVAPTSLQRNPTVMVKMNANGIVTSSNGITTIPTGQVSMVTTPVMRAVSPLKVPVTSVTTIRTTPPTKQIYKHPAPLPAAPNYPIGKRPLPPKPHLNLTRSLCGTGIVLQWKMPYKLESYETIVSYQLYAYQETKSPPKTDNWGKIGDVKALELPMAVTLTQFAVGNRYFFAVRAVDLQKRLGPFSEPENILL
ncbi:hypothetical protein Trydic_g17276 [Trypoxylus dichotomus]